MVHKMGTETRRRQRETQRLRHTVAKAGGALCPTPVRPSVRQGARTAPRRHSRIWWVLRLPGRPQASGPVVSDQIPTGKLAFLFLTCCAS